MKNAHCKTMNTVIVSLLALWISSSGFSGETKGSTELMVTLNPSQAVERGAKWRLRGEDAWRDSGTAAQIDGEPQEGNVFSQQIELKAPPDSMPVSLQMVELAAGEKKTVDIVFSPMPGYRIGGIPDQIFYPKETLRFRVLPPPNSDVAMRAEILGDAETASLNGTFEFKSWPQNPVLRNNAHGEAVGIANRHIADNCADCEFTLADDGLVSYSAFPGKEAPFAVRFIATPTEGSPLVQEVAFTPGERPVPMPEEKKPGTATAGLTGRLAVTFESTHSDSADFSEAKWRFLSEKDEEWRMSGVMREGIPAGRRTIEFRVPPNFMQPEPRNVWIIGGEDVADSYANIVQNLDSYPVYEYPAIPDQRVRVGETLRFRVVSPLDAPEADFYCTTDDREAQPVQLEDGWFSYAPESDVSFSKMFSIIAKNGHETREVSLNVDVLPAVDFEKTVLIETKRPAPEILRTSGDYIERKETILRRGIPFNCKTHDTRLVEIAGVDLVLSPGHPNGIFESIHAVSDANENIEELRLYADKVTLRDRLHLPQTRVFIYARELRFEGESAAIVTTPRDIADLDPNAQEQYSTDGADGLPGGDIHLFIASLTSDNETNATPRFITDGGKGQRGGDGKNGAPGKDMAGNVKGAGPATVFSRWQHYHGWPRNTHYGVSYGTRGWPMDGGDATASGRPGIGGDAGQISSTLGIDVITRSQGGDSGDVGGDMWGGRPGNPNPAGWHASWNLNEFPQYYRHQRWGANVLAPQPEKASGQNGLFRSVKANRLNWLHPAAARQMLAYVRDLYLHGKFEDAREAIESHLYPIEAQAWPDDYNSQLRNVEIQYQNLLSSLDAGLDYFGNPGGWIPALSFEMNYQAYQEELPFAINSLFLTQRVLEQFEKAENDNAALTLLLGALARESEKHAAEYNKLSSDTRGIDEQIAVVVNHTEKIRSELKYVEQILLQRAKANVRDAKWRKRLADITDVAGTIMEVIPYGQPALAAIGASVKTAGQLAVKETTIAEAGIEGVDIWAAYEKRKAKPTEKYEDIQEAVKALRSMKDRMHSRKMPAGAVRNELDRLKKIDPAYNALSEEIQQLLDEKQRLAETMEQYGNAMQKHLAEFYANAQAADQTQAALENTRSVRQLEVKQYALDLRRRTWDRLLVYRYALAKSYEFRLLKPYPGDFRLESLMNRMTAILRYDTSDKDGAKNVELSENDYKALVAIFEEPCREFAASVLTEINGNLWSSRTKTAKYTLTPEEVNLLNTSPALVLNLAERNVFLGNESDIRVRNIGIQRIRVRYIGEPSDDTSIGMEFAHEGESLMENGTDTFVFRHYGENKSSRPSWENVVYLIEGYGGKNGKIESTELSRGDESLLATFLPLEEKPKIERFALPGGMANLRIAMKPNYGGARRPFEMMAEEMTLFIQYDYRQTLDKSRLKIAAEGETEQGEFGSLEVPIEVTTDFGTASYPGTYSELLGTYNNVTVKIPEKYHNWRFDGWYAPGAGIDEFKHGGSRGASFSMDRDREITAIYKYSPAEDDDLGENDGASTPRGHDWPGSVNIYREKIPEIIIHN